MCCRRNSLYCGIYRNKVLFKLVPVGNKVALDICTGLSVAFLLALLPLMLFRPQKVEVSSASPPRQGACCSGQLSDCPAPQPLRRTRIRVPSVVCGAHFSWAAGTDHLPAEIRSDHRHCCWALTFKRSFPSSGYSCPHLRKPQLREAQKVAGGLTAHNRQCWSPGVCHPGLVLRTKPGPQH